MVAMKLKGPQATQAMHHDEAGTVNMAIQFLCTEIMALSEGSG